MANQLLRNKIRNQSFYCFNRIATITTAAARNNLPLESSHQPPRSLNLPATAPARAPSLSDKEISAFYEALVSSHQAKPTQTATIQPEPEILKPKELSILSEIKTPADLGAQNRKHLIQKLSSIRTSHLSVLHSHLQAISINILKNEQPWYTLLQSAALEEDVGDLKVILEALKDFGHDQSLVFGHTLTLIKAIQDPDDACRMRDSLLEAGEQLGLSASSARHQLEVHRMLHLTTNKPMTAYQAADNYVRKLEKAGDPPGIEVYLQLFDFMSHISMRRVTSIDLFNRLRLLAHPNPPITIWNALLRALASGASTQPERAMDAFLDLKANGLKPTVETYNHLIRSMIRARRSAIGTFDRKTGYERWYYSALRLLKQMIDDDGLKPNLGTFLVLLEGAKRVGDLERAKWTYGLFLQQLEQERLNPFANLQEIAWMHVSAVISLFQTYASFSPANKYLLTQQQQKEKAKKAKGRKVPQDIVQPSLNDPQFFRNIPQSTQEILTEIEPILSQFINPNSPYEMKIQTRHQADRRQLSMLISSYLSVYSSHSTIEELYEKYKNYTYPIHELNKQNDIGGAIRISWTYLIILERCEFLRSAAKAGQVAREIFNEWLNNQHALSQFELVQSVESRLTSQMWGAWIRIQAKYGSPEEAMNELEKFHSTYPPKYIPKLKSRRDSEEPNTMMMTENRSLHRLSSSDSNHILNSPYLSFQHVEILHHKLKLIEDHSSINRLKTIVKKYENVRRIAHDTEQIERTNRIQKGY
ncbi:hypothetical protein Pst134EA_000665 [Puccinia striiformis f. sp. tritici]|uniref:hypothetical protein n=1 Tax=Puccinia striiformis f. sp. tritici TaxID=168172 RepID=UPI000A128854|nr:hypothetical protein Pst134EA_000665 [Puccinia striiformis f. sp. tritici]KAH9473585.1 hypothetical protein Pst134EA_000665 [Puccinia striiformis f. sp. tritici]KAI9604426.1 hypothetical protein KEM48_000349 [Puccinia striiformis f. sp. tritici PST-130]